MPFCGWCTCVCQCMCEYEGLLGPVVPVSSPQPGPVRGLLAPQVLPGFGSPGPSSGFHLGIWVTSGKPLPLLGQVGTRPPAVPSSPAASWFRGGRGRLSWEPLFPAPETLPVSPAFSHTHARECACMHAHTCACELVLDPRLCWMSRESAVPHGARQGPFPSQVLDSSWAEDVAGSWARGGGTSWPDPLQHSLGLALGLPMRGQEGGPAVLTRGPCGVTGLDVLTPSLNPGSTAAWHSPPCPLQSPLGAAAPTARTAGPLRPGWLLLCPVLHEAFPGPQDHPGPPCLSTPSSLPYLHTGSPCVSPSGLSAVSPHLV